MTSLRGLIIGRFSENEPALLPASSVPLLQDLTRGSGVNQAFLPPGSPYGLYIYAFTADPDLFKTSTSFIPFVCVLVEHFAPPSCGLTKQMNTATQGQPWASNLSLLPCPKGPLGYLSYLVATLSLTGVTGLFPKHRDFQNTFECKTWIRTRNGDQRTEL